MPRIPPGDCALCGEFGERNREDVYPVWLRRAMATHSLTENQLPEKTILLVCFRCNSGMADAFENPAAPVIKSLMWGRSRGRLIAEESLILARWLIKTDALLAIYRVHYPRPGWHVVTPSQASNLRRMVLGMVADRTLLPSDVIVRVGLMSVDAPERPGPYVPKAARDSVGSSWLGSFHPIALLFSLTWIFVDGDGDAARYRRVTEADPRMVHVRGSLTQWPPTERLPLTGGEVMRWELGHKPENIIAGGWRIGVPGRRD